MIAIVKTVTGHGALCLRIRRKENEDQLVAYLLLRDYGQVFIVCDQGVMPVRQRLDGLIVINVDNLVVALSVDVEVKPVYRVLEVHSILHH